MLMWLLWQNYFNQEVNEDLEIQIVPTNIFYLQKRTKTQSSFITIFSIWNITMGTSLLSTPWALSKSGLLAGIISIVGMNALMLFTCCLIVRSVNHCEEPRKVNDFSDVCREFLGQWGSRISILFSIVTLFCVSIVIWILLSNFLYSTVFYIYEMQQPRNTTVIKAIQGGNNYTYTYKGLLCPSLSNYSLTDQASTSEQDRLFHRIWNKTATVPLFAILIILPISCFRSPTFFTKFNSLGTVVSIYMLAFVIWKSIGWGIHWNVPGTSLAEAGFPSVTGMMSLAFFTHNGVLSVLRCQKHPENNVRDLTIAYVCSCITYVTIGLTFYLCFPLPKDKCIESIFLDNFPADDILSFLGRFGLMLQIITIFPLLLYIMRAQVMLVIFGAFYPSFRHIFIWNCFVTAVCVLFAVFFPEVGTIMRYSGAFGSLFYCFTLPCVVTYYIMKKEDRLFWPMTTFLGLIMVLGLSNFISQIFIE
ncbi:Sodium-coupled neutral amino acid transporter 9-like protein [Trichoplax sp. H2]|nr:Sodium-coupled neutral amino acid transporter 9-like protein [Trichoplax sp. H2]|eukprot:RDD42284.1 Sodium-coupled neutral amino acid transporter 9-like protein [Trichoplax sp. H2]